MSFSCLCHTNRGVNGSANLRCVLVFRQVRGVFSCDEKRANFYFQLANPTHLQPVNHVEIPYLLRSRVSVKEDHKVTRWNPTKVRAAGNVQTAP